MQYLDPFIKIIWNCTTALLQIEKLVYLWGEKDVKYMKIVFGIYLMLAMLMISSCIQIAEPETYLVPSAFSGYVNILFNKKEGSSKKYENNRRVYENLLMAFY